MSPHPPPPPARPAGATWPEPVGRPHPCDGDAIEVVNRAATVLKYGNRLACLSALAEYAFLCRCGVERPDLESRVRGLLAQMGRLPRGHTVPAAVATREELLAVFAVNQDSPQKTFRVGGGFSYCGPEPGERAGSVRLTWSLSALVNHGRERADGREPRSDGDIDGAHVRWDGGEFGRCPADKHGRPKTAAQKRGLAHLALSQWRALQGFEDQARLYGWTLADRDLHADMVWRLCADGGIVSEPPAPAAGTERGRRKKPGVS